jgi:hypothetical protein
MNREEIIRMAREAGVSIRSHYDETGSTPQELERFAALVAAAEREACAKVAENGLIGHTIAKAIRARGEQK